MVIWTHLKRRRLGDIIDVECPPILRLVSSPARWQVCRDDNHDGVV